MLVILFIRAVIFNLDDIFQGFAQIVQAARRPLARPLLRLSRASHLFLVADDGQWPTPENPGRLGRFLATHPPLPERIRRIYGRPRSPLPLPLIDQRTGEPVIELPPHAW